VVISLSTLSPKLWLFLGFSRSQWRPWCWGQWTSSSGIRVSWKTSWIPTSQKGWCHECACEWLNTIYVEWYLVNFYNLDMIEVECFLQVRVSAVLTNGQYLLNLDCDHYINNSKALREAMCFLMDPNLGRSVCYVQFPQRFDGIDRNDRYANRNTVFFDVS